jgi:predicted anti-sigma-YlaC factor YlaD
MTNRPYLTCRQLIEFLDEYVAGDLEGTRREDFERHLKVCPSCRAYLQSYRETIRMARGAFNDPTTLPPELMTAILATVARNTNG